MIIKNKTFIVENNINYIQISKNSQNHMIFEYTFDQVYEHRDCVHHFIGD